MLLPDPAPYDAGDSPNRPDSPRPGQLRSGAGASRAPKLDVVLARSQHHEYRRHLEEAGHTIEVVPTDDSHADCVFIEDTAVIVGEVAVIARPGAVSRQGEAPPVAWALAARFPTTEITAPGTLDGGDVLIMGDVLYLGRSARTNSDGIDQLRTVDFHQGLGVVPREVGGCWSRRAHR